MSRKEEIHEKGFNLTQIKSAPTEYGTITVNGVQTLSDASLNLGALKQLNINYTNKKEVLKAIFENDITTMREISEYFYRASGIYQKACNYFATLYRYDWYIVPEVYNDKLEEDKIVKEFVRTLNYLDNSYIRKISTNIVKAVIVEGAYYGYVLPDNKDGIVIQQLPPQYCRSRYFIGNNPAIEFNMRFFDEKFPDIKRRLKALELFPKEFSEAYILYKQGKLESDISGVTSGSWYLLDPNATIKFSFDNGDIPLFINAIPAILDLDAAQDLDRRKQMQKLLKILIQKLPMDKNGDLIFDVEEAQDIHNNAVAMLSRAIGVDILTTFAEIDSIDLSDRATATTVDDLEKVERAVYNSMGISQNIFNAEGNLSLNNSILNDEGSMRTILLQLSTFYDRLTQNYSSNKRNYKFRLYMLETTQYNYKELSKMYKEQVQIGYSKMLPQIALGHSQSSIINTAYFENEILHLSEIMIPPLMSSTMSSEDILGNKGNSSSSNSQNNTEEGAGGRPEKSQNEKSDKTLQNQQSLS